MAANDQEMELKQARELLARADEHIALQANRIEELRDKGHDTAGAEQFLQVLVDTREVMRRQLEVIEAEIASRPE